MGCYCIIVCEILGYQQRLFVSNAANNSQRVDTNQVNTNTNLPTDPEATRTQRNTSIQYHNQIKLLLLAINIVISIVLSTLLIVFIC